MIIEDVIRFLQNTSPFQLLDPATLEKVARNVSLDFYPREEVILKQNGPPSNSLRIIKKGTVKVLMGTEEGEEIVLEYKGEGDNFGFLSMIGQDRQRTTVKAVEDTICYIIMKEQVLKLLEISPPFTEYFMSYLSRYVDRTYQGMHTKSLYYGPADRLLFTTKVGNIAVKMTTVKEDTPIREAAQVMVFNKISSLIVINKNGLPGGIVTDRDLREKVVAKGRNVQEPIKNIVTLALIRADAQESCFEALMKMIQYNIHHLLVIEEGVVKGIVTNHDLMLLQGTSPVSLTKDILNQSTLEGLRPLMGKIKHVIGLLLKENVKLDQLTRIVSELFDRLIRKVLDFTERELGTPPLPYGVIVYGCEGRREQIYEANQDYALVYADPPASADQVIINRYFANFWPLFGSNLKKIGFSPRPSRFAFGNPTGCQPLSHWKHVFKEWILNPTLASSEEAAIFFDSRPIYGKVGLFQEVRDTLPSYLLQGERNLLKYLAALCLKHPAPVGFHQQFLVEKDGSHKDRFDLQRQAIIPLVDLIRLFALDSGVKETSTLARLNALKGKHSLVKQFGRELEHAFEFIMLLDIHHQQEKVQTGEAVDHILSPDRLSNPERKTLREAFHLITRLHDLIGEWYEPI